MNIFVGVTDKNWFEQLRAQRSEEVNFWNPGGKTFRALRENELFLFNASIELYNQASYNNHEPRRPRVLLLHKSQRTRFLNSIQKKGMTIVPITMYFNHKGILKLSIALARGKNVVDKRETLKKRDWTLQKNRIIRNYNKG